MGALYLAKHNPIAGLAPMGIAGNLVAKKKPLAGTDVLAGGLASKVTGGSKSPATGLLAGG